MGQKSHNTDFPKIFQTDEMGVTLDGSNEWHQFDSGLCKVEEG